MSALDRRKELTFMTLAQLAGVIKDDWEVIPERVQFALEQLSYIDYPDDFELCTKSLRYLNTILANSNRWNTDYSKLIKKEIVQRIKDNEQYLANSNNK